ncbi:hypothetical protein [Pseudoalteromonas denitrificans]|uniref:Uncharacterized protein n=1 Tax=Pseudoalteromonas denitrificans DSM 6059 TaxID=1123010 RepID=A0A1I1KYU9_9GAMM|nr:hypothetical protein [Pseudoalteromonas denitrificans]SFC65835.1 hypothetical protein SAMN02745724_02217 [Pseudoalteromonas denitrificans DSM 6059]
MKKFKWIVWSILFAWTLKVSYYHYIYYTESFPFRYTSIADHILKNERTKLFSAHDKSFMEDGHILDDEFTKLEVIAHFETGLFEMNINTDLDITKAKQLLVDVL